MQKTKVTLLKKHTHAGVEYEAGETIEVSVRAARWMERAGVIPARSGKAGKPEKTNGE